MNITSRLKKIETKLNDKRRNTNVIWPILGGLSTHIPGDDIPDQATRPVTPEEGIKARAKNLPCPILIARSKEKEFLAYLEGD